MRKTTKQCEPLLCFLYEELLSISDIFLEFISLPKQCYYSHLYTPWQGIQFYDSGIPYKKIRMLGCVARGTLILTFISLYELINLLLILPFILYFALKDKLQNEPY